MVSTVDSLDFVVYVSDIGWTFVLYLSYFLGFFFALVHFSNFCSVIGRSKMHAARCSSQWFL